MDRRRSLRREWRKVLSDLVAAGRGRLRYLWPLLFDQDLEALEDEVAIVVQSSCLLDFLLYAVQTGLQQLHKLELSDVHKFAKDHLVLDTALDDRPQRLDGVQLWAVGRHEHQVKVQDLCPFSH